MNRENRQCQSCKQQFTIEPEDFDFYEKIHVPPPTWCPECRMLRRFSFRNQRNFFRRKDAVTDAEIFSSFPPAVSVKIYNLDFWNSDGWDPMEYGRDYNFSEPFFEQFRKLLYEVPWPAKSILRMVNSDYCDSAGGFKNSYLCFNGDDLENCAYSVGSSYTKDSFDIYESDHSELCYDDYMADECYRVFFSVNCESCTDVWFSKDLIGCSNCFGCVNLRNKSYRIFNKPYPKEEYRKYIAGLDLNSRQKIEELRRKTYGFWKQFPVRFTLGIRNINSSGEHVQESKNVKQCYCIHGGENLKYSQFLQGPATDSYDYSVWGERASLMYEALTCGKECYGLRFCWDCWPGSKDLEYCVFVRSSSDLFGCVGLKKKQYCILNRQYPKEEYEKLRKKITAHMNEAPYISHSANRESQIAYRYGEFFPPEFSPFAYNETIAQDFFTLSEAEAKSKGFRWRDPELREYQTTVNASDLPDRIKEAPDSIVKEVIKCMSCGGAYRVIPMELDFYRRIGLPLPRLCHNCRYRERFKFVNPPKLWHGNCMCAGKTSKPSGENFVYVNLGPHSHSETPCPNEFETSFAPGRPEIVYCESCYQNEVA